MLFLGKPVAVVATWKALPLWPSLAQSTISRVLFFSKRDHQLHCPQKITENKLFGCPQRTQTVGRTVLSLSLNFPIWPFLFFFYYFTTIVRNKWKCFNFDKKPIGHSVKALLWFCFIQVPPYLDWNSIQWNRLENNVITHNLWRLWLVFNNVWWLDLSSQEQVNHFVNQLKSPLVASDTDMICSFFFSPGAYHANFILFFSFGTNPITTLTHITVILCVCVCLANFNLLAKFDFFEIFLLGKIGLWGSNCDG